MFLDPEQPIEKHRFGLPHWHQNDTGVFVTWRLADSLPKQVVEHLEKTRETWRKTHPQPWDDKTAAEFNQKFTLVLEQFLDDCHGSCCLREANLRAIMVEALQYFDGERYRLDHYVVMPNHVHAIFQLKEGFPLEGMMHSLKSFTAKKINKERGTTGEVWQSRYWDRLIRSQKHLDWTRRYIVKNPEKLRDGEFTLWP